MPKLELLVTHTHAGAIYQAGHVLDVDSYTAKWMIERGIANIANVVDTARNAAIIGEHAPKKPKKAHAKPFTSNKE